MSWPFESGPGDLQSLLSCSFRFCTWRSAVLSESFFRAWTWRSAVLTEFVSILDLENSSPYWVICFESGPGDQLSLLSCSFRVWVCRLGVLSEVFASSQDLQLNVVVNCLFRVWAWRSAILSYSYFSTVYNLRISLLVCNVLRLEKFFEEVKNLFACHETASLRSVVTGVQHCFLSRVGLTQLTHLYLLCYASVLCLAST